MVGAATEGIEAEASRPPTLIIAPMQLIPLPWVFAAIAILGVLALVFVRIVGRFAAPTSAATVALVVLIGLTAVMAYTHRRRATGALRVFNTVALVAVGLLLGVLGWFFGPNSAFEAFVTLAVVVIGALSGGHAVRLPALAGWLAFGAIVLGQAAAFTLVTTGALPDHSLTIVIIEGHPMWHHVAAHASIQSIIVVAFLSARAFQRRYASLVTEVRTAVRDSARREALLDEARTEYKRTLALGRGGLFSGRTLGDYQLGRLLGRGRGTELYRAVHMSKGTAATVQVESRDGRMVVEPAESTDVSSKDDLERDPAPEGSLAAELANGPLPTARLGSLLEDLMRELAAIHARGMVHGELTPRTVLSSDGGAWSLAAPGADQPLGAGSLDLRYVAPERIAGRGVDARADLYSAAAVLYEAATGCPPFAAESPTTLAKAVLRRLPVAPRHLFAVSSALERVLQTGLAKKPDDRFQSTEAFQAAFDDALAADTEISDSKLDADSGVTDWFTGSSDSASVPVPLTIVTGAPAAVVPEAETKLLDEGDYVDRPSLSASPPRVSTAPGEAWNEAYRRKMRRFYVLMTVLCVGGVGLLGFIAREPAPFYAAVASIAGIVGFAWLHRWLQARAPSHAPYWPWTAIAALSVGPAYCLGLHSAFAAVIVAWLFAGGVFRADRPAGPAWRGDWIVIAGVVTTHTLVFLGMLAGVVPDDGNVAVFQTGAPAWETPILHLLVMTTYAAAFAAGRTVDTRQRQLTEKAEVAGRAAAEQGLALAAARSELAALTRERGIFAGLSIARYTVGSLLGRGGMGEVYEATEAESGRRVALKLVRGDRVAEPRVLRMFLEESTALAQVDSPHVARVLDVADLDAELPYIAMEFIEGETLAAILREREVLSLDEARTLVRDVARGLIDVHAAGVLHCDLKPHNVLATREGGWKLVDFGLAIRLKAGEAVRGYAAGTPGYMAPEQALREPVDTRADLFSLCAVAYRALTGHPAFPPREPRIVARRAREGGPADPSAYADVPEEVALVLRIGLAGHAADRFSSASEAAAAFEQAFDGHLDPAFRRRASMLLVQSPWS